MSDEATAAIFVDMLLAELPQRLHLNVFTAVHNSGGGKQLAVDVHLVHRDPVTKKDTTLAFGQSRTLL